MSEDGSAERVARNNAIFRTANERIEGAAVAYSPGDPVPFLCECADPTCTEIARMSLEEYEGIRAFPTRFITTHGSENNSWATLVARGAGYDVVEKTGEAAEIAKELDPRGD